MILTEIFTNGALETPTPKSPFTNRDNLRFGHGLVITSNSIMWDATTHPCLNFHDGSTKPP